MKYEKEDKEDTFPIHKITTSELIFSLLLPQPFPQVPIKRIQHIHNFLTLIKLHFLQLINRHFPLDMWEFALIDYCVAHHVFINQEIGVVYGLDLGVLVLVDVL